MNGYTHEDLKAALNVVEALRAQTLETDLRVLASAGDTPMICLEESKASTLRALDIVEDLIRLSF